MKFLKKASYKDILGVERKNKYHYYEDVTSKYKEFELYLTQADLNDLLGNKEKCYDKLVRKLKKDGAVISAIHCPESCIRTRNESTGEMSGNYLSLCEIIRNKENSREVFKNLLKLAGKIYCEQQGDSRENQNPPIIVVIHEGCERGCVTNDSSETKPCTGWNVDKIASAVKSIIADTAGVGEKTIKIDIALENITPFYSKEKINIGTNCGWKKEEQKQKILFLKNVKKKIEEIENEIEKANEETKKSKIEIRVGLCIDFCHIMVSDAIMGNTGSKAESIKKYFADSQSEKGYFEYIFLYHVSNYGEDWSHGQLFSYDNEEDRAALEIIKELCNKSKKGTPVTFEMADGIDPEKASLNYEHMMFDFSNKHSYGRFGELLGKKENEDLKDFFEELFHVYTYDKKHVFEITNSLWKIKKFILKNQYKKSQDEQEQLFGFDFNQTELNLSLARLKAYLYYTRFCNLGNFLANSCYMKEGSIWSDIEDLKEREERMAEDFGLAMKYFMFNDSIRQCVYTGIRYKFLIDFLPKRENFVRFNDGIGELQPILSKDGVVNSKIFKQVVEKIVNHVNGKFDTEESSEKSYYFYSVGKNFGQCLFKYFNSSHDWSLQIYKNQPINYVDYNGKRYSIQAFTRFLLHNNQNNQGTKENVLDLSIDVSGFASGRGGDSTDGDSTDSLQGFVRAFLPNLPKGTIIKERVGSIEDGEVLFTKLPECTLSLEQDVKEDTKEDIKEDTKEEAIEDAKTDAEYRLLGQGILLKWMFLNMKSKQDCPLMYTKRPAKKIKEKASELFKDNQMQLLLDDNKIKEITEKIEGKIEEEIEKINAEINNKDDEETIEDKSKVFEIFKQIREFEWNKNATSNKLQGLDPYGKNWTDRDYFNLLKSNIGFNNEGDRKKCATIVAKKH